MSQKKQEIVRAISEPETIEMPYYDRDLAAIKLSSCSELKINLMLDEMKSMISDTKSNPNKYCGIEDYLKKVRLLLFVLEQHQKAKLTLDQREKIRDIQEISGKIPTLNSNITDTLIQNGYTLNIRDNNICRDRETVKKKIGFYRSDDKPIVRTLLIEEEEYRNRDFSSGGRKFYISHANADYYSVTADLHADHLQPAMQITDRLLELVEAMNLCESFALSMHRAHPDYFQKEQGKWYGRRKLFLDYYNCPENLWLMNGGANVGKQSNDPLDYLKNHPFFGERFFSYLADEKGAISKDAIIYTVGGAPLAKVAKDWFATHYSHTKAVIHMQTESTYKMKQVAMTHDHNRAEFQKMRNDYYSSSLNKRNNRGRAKEDEASTPEQKRRVQEIKFLKRIFKQNKRDLENAAMLNAEITEQTVTRIKERLKLHSRDKYDSNEEIDSTSSSEVAFNPIQLPKKLQLTKEFSSGMMSDLSRRMQSEHLNSCKTGSEATKKFKL